MDLSDAVTGFHCLSCTASIPRGAYTRCPDCNGYLEVTYDSATLSEFHDTLLADTSTDFDRNDRGIWGFEPILPSPGTEGLSIQEGQTPCIDAPSLESSWDAHSVQIKDEGRNGTGSIVDREMAVSVTMARKADANTVALPTTGNDGQSASAYAARGGLSAESFVPSRAPFQNKAMINVHGGEMNVVGGRYPDAVEAFQNAIRENEWYSLSPFDTPYRQEGAKTIAYELIAHLGQAPDVVVHPMGHGTALAGIAKGFAELEATGHIEAEPRLFVVQADGCAPLVTAWNEGKEHIEPVENPDTICGSLEIPAPPAGEHLLGILERTGGGAISVTDDQLLEAATSLAGDGVPLSLPGGAAVAGAETLLDQQTIRRDESLVLINPSNANREADRLRSHLMRKGI